MIEQFAAWCVQSGNDFQVFAWSDSDLLQILDELTLKKIDPSRTLELVMDQWTNYQAEYDELIGGNPMKPTSLAHALIYSGLPFTGKMHDALYDARNTARLYIETLDGDRYPKMVSDIRSCMNGEEQHTCLGDLFDFSSLLNAAAS